MRTEHGFLAERERKEVIFYCQYSCRHHHLIVVAIFQCIAQQAHAPFVVWSGGVDEKCLKDGFFMIANNLDRNESCWLESVVQKCSS